MKRTLLLLSAFLVAPLATSEPYNICIISDAPDPACFVLDTPLPKDDIIALVEYPSGNTEINIAGVEVNLDCTDTDGDGFSEKCLMTVEAADSPYHPYGTVLSVTCSGTTLLSQKSDGEGGTYTNSQMNSVQCGYVAPDDDPCYNGTWYVGQGNPECEDVSDMEYRKYCTPLGASGSYVQADTDSCIF